MSKSMPRQGDVLTAPALNGILAGIAHGRSFTPFHDGDALSAALLNERFAQVGCKTRFVKGQTLAARDLRAAVAYCRKG